MEPLPEIVIRVRGGVAEADCATHACIVHIIDECGINAGDEFLRQNGQALSADPESVAAAITDAENRSAMRQEELR